LARARSIEEFHFGSISSDSDITEISFVDNLNLHSLWFGGDCLALEYINLKNGANLKLESIYINPHCHVSSTGGICIDAENPDYVRSKIEISQDMSDPIDTVVTADCNN
jgi:hypothetical protein